MALACGSPVTRHSRFHLRSTWLWESWPELQETPLPGRRGELQARKWSNPGRGWGEDTSHPAGQTQNRLVTVTAFLPVTGRPLGVSHLMGQTEGDKGKITSRGAGQGSRALPWVKAIGGTLSWGVDGSP